LLQRWRSDPQTAENIAAWRVTPAHAADLHPLPADLPAALADSLRAQGIDHLYSHQAEAWNAARHGANLILATGTASGKTLAYNLPVLATLLEKPSARALYLFPTKALAQDQLATINEQFSTESGQLDSLRPCIYDGDTPQSQRKVIRQKARMLFSNPDMLHTGILPHHTTWAEFFSGLKFVILDETHTYRGVFGSHVANVLRRLKRVAAFYGATPQFLLASATIGNPRELAENLIEAPVTLVDGDGSACGERHFLLYNPPVVDETLGLRKGILSEAARLARDLYAAEVQTVVFARSRRSVEMLLTDLQTGTRDIRGYRSGYLPGQRREIERGLRAGTVKVVVATNALELGIDIGGLGAALLTGYPGSVASLTQQAGRAGRGAESAAAILIASANPLDQFLAHHPDYLFGRAPEQALIDPNHLLILLNHLRCALFELPFARGDAFGTVPAQMLAELLQFLSANGEAHASAEKIFWMADAYPAADVSLRSASPETVVIQTSEAHPQTIGEVDGASALWMVHPGAVYLHEGQQFFIHTLDLEKHLALATAVSLEYYTEPVKQTRVTLLACREQTAEHGWGKVQVTAQVMGYKKIRWGTRAPLGQEPLDLPAQEMETTAFWLGIAPALVDALSRDGLWTNAPNEYGPEWPSLRERVRARDGFRCQNCGVAESSARQHDVHHKIPFRAFLRSESGDLIARRRQANQMSNLTTLCPACHHQTEQNVRIRSGLAGLGYALGQLAPLFLLCDPGDLGVHIEAQASESFPNPAVIFYELIPAGIGFSEKLFHLRADLLKRALEVVRACPCADGCPSCVGPGGENGAGGKAESLALLERLVPELSGTSERWSVGRMQNDE